jgi:hypothetical protein
MVDPDPIMELGAPPLEAEAPTAPDPGAALAKIAALGPDPDRAGVAEPEGPAPALEPEPVPPLVPAFAAAVPFIPEPALPPLVDVAVTLPALDAPLAPLSLELTLPSVAPPVAPIAKVKASEPEPDPVPELLAELAPPLPFRPAVPSAPPPLVALPTVVDPPTGCGSEPFESLAAPAPDAAAVTVPSAPDEVTFAGDVEEIVVAPRPPRTFELAPVLLLEESGLIAGAWTMVDAVFGLGVKAAVTGLTVKTPVDA